jgi:hypothetical protein
VQQQPQLKTLPKIFVTIDGRIPPWAIVTGRTWPRHKAIGSAGLGFKWIPEKKAWEKPCSRKDLEALIAWPEVALSHEAQEQMELYRRSAAIQKEYYQRKARQKPITRLKPMTQEERAARKALIEANRLKREASYKARKEASPMKDRCLNPVPAL